MDSNNNNNQHNITEIKSQLSLLNQQLLSKLIPPASSSSPSSRSSSSPKTSTTTPTSNQDDQNQCDIKPIELITIISKVEQYCDQLMKSEMTSQSQLHQKENLLNQQQLELKQQQQQFDLQCERREFELIKRESQLFQQHISTTNNHNNNNNHHHQQQHIPYHSQSFIHNNTINSSTPQLEHNDLSNYNNNNNHNSTTQHNHFNNNDHNDNDVNQIQFIELLHDVHQDYQAMKYLVEQNATNDIGNKISQLESIVYEVKETVETNIRNEINEIQTNMNKSNEDMKINIDTKLNQFDTKLGRFDIRISDLPSKINKNSQMVDDKLNKFDQRLIVFEQSFQQYIIQQYRIQTIENQRKLVQLVLDENEKLKKREYEFIIFQFENLQNVRISCFCWTFNNLSDLLTNWAIKKYLKEDLEQYIPMIENGKLFISTKSILDGEWIQVQGDDKIVDIKTLDKSKLLKPGDDIYDYKDYQCSKKCSNCNGSPPNTTSKRFLIKIKWE